MLKEEIAKNFKYRIGHNVFTIPSVMLIKNQNGTFSINQLETRRIHDIIVREICDNADPLDWHHFTFLYQVTKTRLRKLVKDFEISRATLLFWRNSKFIDGEMSKSLKQYFFQKAYRN